jgi:hypothetical protein
MNDASRPARKSAFFKYVTLPKHGTGLVHRIINKGADIYFTLICWRERCLADASHGTAFNARRFNSGAKLLSQRQSIQRGHRANLGSQTPELRGCT